MRKLIILILLTVSITGYSQVTSRTRTLMRDTVKGNEDITIYAAESPWENFDLWISVNTKTIGGTADGFMYLRAIDFAGNKMPARSKVDFISSSRWDFMYQGDTARIYPNRSYCFYVKNSPYRKFVLECHGTRNDTTEIRLKYKIVKK